MLVAFLRSQFAVVPSHLRKRLQYAVYRRAFRFRDAHGRRCKEFLITRRQGGISQFGRERVAKPLGRPA